MASSDSEDADYVPVGKDVASDGEDGANGQIHNLHKAKADMANRNARDGGIVLEDEEEPADDEAEDNETREPDLKKPRVNYPEKDNDAEYSEGEDDVEPVGKAAKVGNEKVGVNDTSKSLKVSANDVEEEDESDDDFDPDDAEEGSAEGSDAEEEDGSGADPGDPSRLKRVDHDENKDNDEEDDEEDDDYNEDGGDEGSDGDDDPAV